jgi:hypothetical protein
MVSEGLTQVVPVFVAVMVWLIRVLIIGTFSVAGDRLFSTGTAPASAPRAYAPSSGRSPVPSSAVRPVSAMPRTSTSSLRAAPKPGAPATFERMEPTYQNIALDAAPSDAGFERRLQ